MNLHFIKLIKFSKMTKPAMLVGNSILASPSPLSSHKPNTSPSWGGAKGKERNEYVDLLKGFGILTVVAGHCGFPLLLWVNPYAFHMPLFFFISGFFLNMSRTNYDFLKNKVERLLFPYYKYWIAFGFLYGVLHWSNLKATRNFSLDNILTLEKILYEPFLHGHQFPLILPLWFLTTLFICMAVVCFSRSLLKDLGKSKNLSFLSFFLLFFLSIGLSYFSVSWKDSPLQSFLFRLGLCLAFIYMGYFWWKAKMMLFTPSLIAIGTLTFLVLIWNFNPSYTLIWTNLGSPTQKCILPLVSLSGVYFSLFIISIFKLNGFCRKFLCYCGKKSLHVMALHLSGFFVLNILLTLLPEYTIAQIGARVYFRFKDIPPAFYFAFSVGFSLFLCFIYDKFVRILSAYREANRGPMIVK